MYRVLLISASLLISPTAKAAPLDVFGTWLNEKQTSIIEISECEGAPCGTIIWIDHPAPETLVDDENPDPNLQAQPLLGLTILQGFEARGDQWKKGRIYDPESGKSYNSRLRRNDDNTLEVKGCVGPICQTQIWTPSAGPSPATTSTSTPAED